MGALQSSVVIKFTIIWPSRSLVILRPSGFLTTGVPIVWKNTFEGMGSPFVVAFASKLVSSFLLMFMCWSVNPLNYFSRLHMTNKYCMRTSSLAVQSFSI
jgi:hypothetical protein